jgi:hypothetical protein
MINHPCQQGGEFISHEINDKMTLYKAALSQCAACVSNEAFFSTLGFGLFLRLATK